MRKLLSKLILKLHSILIRAYINKKYKAMLWRLAYLRYLCNIRQHFGTVAGVANTRGKSGQQRVSCFRKWKLLATV